MTQQMKSRLDQIRRGKVPEGYIKTKVGIIPNQWEVKEIGEFLLEYSHLSNDILTFQVYSSSRQGLIPQSKYYDNRESVETNLGYKMVPDRYATYRHMSDDDIFHFNINTTGNTVLVSSEYPVFTVNDRCSLAYVVSVLNETPRFRYFCRSQKLGGTRTRLYYKNLSKYRAPFPPLPEQQKIAKILSTQDKVIGLYDKKIEQLQLLKKACLQKMFPKRGSKVPEIRFPGFTDDWEQRKLKDVADSFEYGLNAAAKEFDGTNKYLRITDIDDALRAFSDDDLTSPDTDLATADNYRLQNGDVLFARTGASVGKSYIYRESDGRVYFAGFLIRARIKPENSAEFVFQNTLTSQYEKYILITSQRSGQPGVNAQEYGEYSILMPDYSEQEKIGDFLRKIDRLITLHQRRRDEEKQKKKALMQLLLSGIVRVKI